MASNKFVYQCARNVSVPRDKMLEIACNPMFNKKDYRVFLILLTQLEGYVRPEKGKDNDPMNFKKIDIESISESLGIKKKEVKESIRNLMDAFLLETGDSETIKNGYRFTF